MKIILRYIIIICVIFRNIIAKDNFAKLNIGFCIIYNWNSFQLILFVIYL